MSAKDRQRWNWLRDKYRYSLVNRHMLTSGNPTHLFWQHLLRSQIQPSRWSHFRSPPSLGLKHHAWYVPLCVCLCLRGWVLNLCYEFLGTTMMHGFILKQYWNNSEQSFKNKLSLRLYHAHPYFKNHCSFIGIIIHVQNISSKITLKHFTDDIWHIQEVK